MNQPSSTLKAPGHSLWSGAIASILFITLALSACSGEQQTKSDKMQPKDEVMKPAPRITMQDFFKNPETFRYRLSPDGATLSWLAPYKDRMNLFTRPLDGSTQTRVTNDTTRDIRLYFWANDSELMYLQDAGGDENWQLFLTSKDGTGTRSLTPPGYQTQIIDPLEDLDDEIIIAINQRDPRLFDPYRLHLSTGKMELLAQNDGSITSWATDHEGKVRIAQRTIGTDVVVMWRQTEDADWDVIDTFDFRTTFQPLMFTFDNERMYALSDVDRDRAAIVEFDPATKKEVKVIYENPDYDAGGLNYSHKRNVLTYVDFTSWKSERHFLDKKTKQIDRAIETELGNVDRTVLASTKDESKYIFVTGGDHFPTIYYIYNDKDGSIDKIANTTPWLKSDELAEMKPIEYKSRDGLTIHGYLTLPRGVKAENLPVVVNPHGGPWARDVWGFNPEVQYLANRGYAVLQMNFRGSVGYGKSFWQAGFKQWGQSMQDDITDGVNWLIDQGIADRDRVAIYGASYGGYATLAGITLTPDLYSAAIDYVGVSNLFTFMKTIPPYWEPYKQMMYEMVGDPNTEDSVMMKAVSPVFQVDKIKTPLFIAQGARDPRVNIDESNQMVEALRAKGVTVDYLVKDNEGHGFSNQENRFEFYERMTEFLDQQMGVQADEL